MNPPQQSGTGTPPTDPAIQRAMECEYERGRESMRFTAARYERSLIETCEVRDSLRAQLQAKEQELAEAKAQSRTHLEAFEYAHARRNDAECQLDHAKWLLSKVNTTSWDDLRQQLAARDATIAGLRDAGNALANYYQPGPIPTAEPREIDFLVSDWNEAYAKITSDIPRPRQTPNAGTKAMGEAARQETGQRQNTTEASQGDNSRSDEVVSQVPPPKPGALAELEKEKADHADTLSKWNEALDVGLRTVNERDDLYRQLTALLAAGGKMRAFIRRTANPAQEECTRDWDMLRQAMTAPASPVSTITHRKGETPCLHKSGYFQFEDSYFCNDCNEPESDEPDAGQARTDGI